MNDQELVQEILKNVNKNAITLEEAFGITQKIGDEHTSLTVNYVFDSIINSKVGDAGKGLIKFLENAKTPNEMLYLMACLGAAMENVRRGIK
jgi:hypothetical protein